MFAKIHESPEKGQILITREYDPDEDKFKITLWFEYEEMMMKISFGHEDKAKSDEVFEWLTLEESEKLIDNSLKQITG